MINNTTLKVDDEGREWKVVTLPDDPRLSHQASRRRTLSQSKAWKRRRFTPRSVTKTHEHHLLTEVLD
jgi:hypothetical protein